MAYADYLHCIECDAKAVYDADWYDRVDNEDGDGWKGQVEALCPNCAQTKILVVAEREPGGEG